MTCCRPSSPTSTGSRRRAATPALLTPVLGVESRYLDAALDELHSRFGTIESDFAQGLGIDAEGQRALRAIFVA